MQRLFEICKPLTMRLVMQEFGPPCGRRRNAGLARAKPPHARFNASAPVVMLRDATERARPVHARGGPARTK